MIKVLKKVPYITPILTLLTGVLGYYVYDLFKRKSSTGTAVSSSTGASMNLSEDEIHYLQKVSKDIAKALGTDPDQNFWQRWTENEVRAFNLVKDSIDNKEYVKLIYDTYTGRNLEHDLKEYLRGAQIQMLNDLNYF